MWTCPHCGASEPLEFQRGHIRSCHKWPSEPEPGIVQVIPAMQGVEVKDLTVPYVDADGEEWDLLF